MPITSFENKDDVVRGNFFEMQRVKAGKYRAIIPEPYTLSDCIVIVDGRINYPGADADYKIIGSEQLLFTDPSIYPLPYEKVLLYIPRVTSVDDAYQRIELLENKIITLEERINALEESSRKTRNSSKTISSE